MYLTECNDKKIINNELDTDHGIILSFNYTLTSPLMYLIGITSSPASQHGNFILTVRMLSTFGCGVHRCSVGIRAWHTFYKRKFSQTGTRRHVNTHYHNYKQCHKVTIHNRWSLLSSSVCFCIHLKD